MEKEVALRNSEKEAAARFAIIGAASLGVIKLAVGIMLNSIGIISAAVDSLVDVFISAMNLFSIRLAESPADAGHPYGHGKAENLAGLFQAAAIAIIGGWVVYDSIRRLLLGIVPTRVDWGIAVMLISILGSWIIVRRLAHVGRKTDSIVLMTDSLHYASDIWTNLGVLVALVLTRLTGKGLFDPLIGIGVGGVILMASAKLMKRSIEDLMDTAVPEETRREIERVITRHSAVLSFHDLRTRRAGSQKLIDLSLVLCRHLQLGDTHDLVDHIEKEIEATITHSDVVIHPEPCHGECPPNSRHCILYRKDDLLAHASR